MNYPLISEYIEAIKAAEENFEQLKHLRPVMGDDGLPVMSGGNFAVVFKMKDEQTGKLHAVKCFLKEQEGRAEAYRLIAEELEYVSSTFLTPIKYLDNELFVDSAQTTETEFPVLLMDWVEGQTLDKYIREHIDDQYELSLLAYQFSRLAMWLMPQPFAHGDLKPDNILVKDDGTLVLVDYDGMYVPAMKGQRARELGSPDFRHPGRTEDIFDEHIDDFSLVSILLSLKAISLQPDLLEKYGASDRLLFSANDYLNLSESRVMDAIKSMMQDQELATLYSLFILSSAQNNLSQASFRLFDLKRPQKKNIGLKRLKITKPIVNVQKELIPFFQGKVNVTHIISPTGTESYITSGRNFRDEAYTIGACKLNTVENDKKHVLFLFNDKDAEVGRYYITKKLQGKKPAQLTKMKEILAFFESWNPETKQWVPCVGIAGDTIQKMDALRTNVTEEDLANAWTDEFGVKYSSDGKRLLRVFNDNLPPYSVRNGTMVICDEAFSWVISAGYGVFEDSDNLTQIRLPDSLVIIGERAFCGLKSLKEINIPHTIKKIGDSAFYMCESLKSINIPNTISEIGESVFSECGFSHINIPGSIHKIGDYAFYNCKNLQRVVIPDSVTQLGVGAFGGCSSLMQVTIPESITELGYEVFSGSAFSQIEIPQSITKIGSRAFWNSSLTQINIPDSVIVIEEGAFYGSCLEKIELSNSITEIADSTFYDCFALKQISIPKSVTQIADHAFYGCNYLSQIELPESIKYIGGGAFLFCESLSQIIIPNSVVELGNMVFSNCHSLKYITFSGVVNKIGNDIFCECDALEQIFIPIGTKKKFEKLLPDFKEKLVEQEMGWTVKDSRPFNSEEIALVRRAEVVRSDYGNSVCFFMQTGGQTYIPLSKQSKLTVGDELDIRTAKLMTLSRDGKADITRVIE